MTTKTVTKRSAAINARDLAVAKAWCQFTGTQVNPATRVNLRRVSGRLDVLASAIARMQLEVARALDERGV